MRIYRNASIVAMNEAIDVLENSCVGVEGKKIAYVGPWKEEFASVETIDCTGKIIMPGFVNGHAHMPMTLFRGYADDLSLHVWLNTRIFPMEKKHNAFTEQAGAMLAAAELTRCGVTTINDMYYHAAYTAQALEQAGLRGIVNSCLIGLSDNHEAMVEDTLAAAEIHRDSDLIRVSMAPHAEYTATRELLEKWARIAIDHKMPIHIHCSETRAEHEECKQRHGMTPVALLNKLGYFQTDVFLAHCVYVEEDDMDLIRKGNAAVLHNPCSNLKLGSGVAPVPRMMEKGLHIALSTDGSASNNTQDMWEEMRVAALLHKGISGNAAVLPAEQALYMATRGGALALGYTDTGCIQEGMRADFLVVDASAPSWLPRTNLINLIVYSGNSRDIVETVAGGETIYRNGVYTRLDIEKISADAQQAFDTVFRD